VGDTETPALSDPTEDYFALGELDLYILSSLADNLSFLGELVFELNSDDEYEVDVERLFLKYTFSDRVWLSLGRRHTPLGYWNETFHHGRLLEPTAERPSALRFEDDGGILPLHTVGINVGGRIFVNEWGFDYSTGVGNGRGLTREDVQDGGDLNDQKSVFLKLAATRSGKHEVRFGPMVYVDHIPPDPMVPGQLTLDEQVLGFHFHYRSDNWEVFSEYYDISHDDGTEFNSDAYYAIAVWRPWKWKPYAGFDSRTLDPADRFYDDLEPEFSRYLGGVRWDVSPFMAFKFEYRHDVFDVEEVTIDSLAFQAAFTF